MANFFWGIPIGWDHTYFVDGEANLIVDSLIGTILLHKHALRDGPDLWAIIMFEVAVGLKVALRGCASGNLTVNNGIKTIDKNVIKEMISIK